MKTLPKLAAVAALAFIALTQEANAQKLEISVNANTGFSGFTGPGTANGENYFQGTANNYYPYYVSNPFIKKLALGYGGNIQFKYVGKTGLLSGLQAGYDVTKSKNKNIDNYLYTTEYYPLSSYLPIAPIYTRVDGYDVLTYGFITLDPYVGYRVKMHQLSLDVMLGAEAGINVLSQEKVYIPSLNAQVKTDRDKQNMDWHIKPALALNYKRIILNASYAWGLSNYIRNTSKQITGKDDQKVHSQLIRFGLGYRIY